MHAVEGLAADEALERLDARPNSRIASERLRPRLRERSRSIWLASAYWDLDAAITNANAHIYGRPSKRRFEQSDYERVTLNHPDFRVRYNTTLLGLTAPGGPLSETRLHAFLDAVEPALAAPLAQDPFQPIAAASHFAGLRDWVSDRVAVVRQLASANQPAPRPPYAP